MITGRLSRVDERCNITGWAHKGGRHAANEDLDCLIEGQAESQKGMAFKGFNTVLLLITHVLMAKIFIRDNLSPLIRTRLCCMYSAK